MLQITNALNIFTVRKKTTKKKLPVTERDKQNLRIGSVFKKKKKIHSKTNTFSRVSDLDIYHQGSSEKL